MSWEPVIGLELHAQLSTRSKIFSGASTAYGAEPNTQACAVDLALPGVLPVLNAEAARMAVMFGLAINADIARRSVFARKNYFYPDLPKGYQISQYELPIVFDGHVEIDLEDGRSKRVGIIRAHLEEDAGKSLHDVFQGMSGIDLNRAGTPLLEIVSQPDLRSAREAVAYMRKIHSIVRYLGICDGNMEQGSFRCDANVSVRPAGRETYGTRTELKNLNSFRFVERAISYEIERQTEILESGGQVVQATRLYDPDANETRLMRTKEEAEDYRYFPDPDLLPLGLTDEYIEEVRSSLPELPDAKKHRFMQAYGLNAYDASVLTASRELGDYYEATVSAAQGQAKMAANWVMGDLTGALNKAGLDIGESPVSPAMLGGLIRRIADETISGKIAKEVFDALWGGEGDADTVIEARGLRQVTDTREIERMVDDVLVRHPDQVAQYRAGKEKLLGFFVGQIMKASGGKANPQQVNAVLKEKLSRDA
ncbi:MAG: Asp-tRNA(Asn)/Glu-tRNA(Gln) amidotransferase subunit GatB [Gammaproteobacteria bacterium]|nr:Asp-tRNA(Asn)/Glu-tRNA(Gln) amidotransferase subunit GatB [Gammaproteobacteria bacterium]NIR84214.1 Asp-tRNA(Asn)/Glu-tRNA(Gln) amidotransferase subunit GatB [Gammaproteobacteria bacterium]NIR89684.1 Asp-tRNA(Asn)/Glu-tRNA(Gln) amidotransferase subunit GatB [Gammaproteobacteria bacterium]NIU05372.1 Asp-tRNA(Asn)/Glu-tRNA(Gln) amidotransferase subunit GatB [Gammaproteobacteria bacterium]NIV52318.1 Asp-tRNA(Asn)/Glu-tRNA(Gln) amidotransferase subunit GatB [Gammaproteobacteria bacterium]